MMGFLVISFVLATAVTALAYGRPDVATAMTGNWSPGEPATLLLSGSALLGVAGALRRYAF